MAGRFGLWLLTGLAWVLTVMGMFSIGVFVLPFAVGLLALSIVLTRRRPGSWPAVAGLGLALAAGLTWLGVVLGRAGPSEMTCWGDSTGAEACVSDGRPVDLAAFGWGAAAPWIVAAAVVALLSGVAYAGAQRLVTRGLVRSP